MNNNEMQYLNLLKKLVDEGRFKEDRTGTGTYSLFGHQLRFDLNENFPLLTTKKVPFKLIASELLWFLHGDTNIRYLLENNNHIWDEWAFKNYVESTEYQGPDMTDFGLRSQSDLEFKQEYDIQHGKFVEQILNDTAFSKKFGELGPVYGKQWRNWQTTTGETIDQLVGVISEIERNPDSRRLIVNAWNPEDVPSMALPPCHTLFQFYVLDGKLSCQLYQRSGDVFLGVPFNIASYALLTHIVAKICGLQVGELIHTLGDVHLYANHVEQAKIQLSRKPNPGPTLNVSYQKKEDITEALAGFQLSDFKLDGYQPQNTIKAAVAV